METLEFADEFGGFVLRVNECLRDASSSNGQSGSDEEKKAVAFDDSTDSVTGALTSLAVEATEQSTAPPAVLSPFPCLFYSYTAGCVNGEECEYSHSIHADQVPAPVASQKRGLARHRIKRRLAQYFAVQNIYEVQDQLQEEARKGSYAKFLIRSHLTGAVSSPSAAATSPAAAVPR